MMIQIERFVLVILGISQSLTPLLGFLLPRPTGSTRRQALKGSTSLPSTDQSKSNDEDTAKSEKKKAVTIKEYTRQVLANPAKYFPEPVKTKKKSNYKRTRRRVENPKQTYLYAAQRRAVLKQQNQQNEGPDSDSTDVGAPKPDGTSDEFAKQLQSILDLVAELNMAKLSTLHCDPLFEQKPKLVAKIWVSSDDTDTSSGSAYAFLIDKPAGWAIFGTKVSVSSPDKQEEELAEHQLIKQRVKIINDDGTVEYLEYSEQDVFELMTTEEIQLFLDEGGELPQGVTINKPKKNRFLSESSKSSTTSKTYGLDNAEPDGTSEQETLDFMTANEVMQESDGELPSSTNALNQEDESYYHDDSYNRARLENLRRIESRRKEGISKPSASFLNNTRPSVVNWLKKTLAHQNNSIVKGGSFWTAIAGATDVDDSGLVLLCPKSATSNIFCDSIGYIAVVGNGNCLAPTTNTDLKGGEKVEIKSLAKLKKARAENAVETVRIDVPEQLSNCNSIVQLCQQQFLDGIRGDPLAHPLDRRAHRRLIHCQEMTVSSLVQDECVHVSSPTVPDDISVLSERRDRFTYQKGSFLGRASLREAEHTNAYREINGVADGFPGWVVDRYDRWLLVQHDPDHPRGPLPSIHDGNTAGVYILETRSNSRSMTPHEVVGPRLLEGQPAPRLFPILENGIKYLVSLDKDMSSTGIFLDQRPQRAWLARHCGPETRILNCFARTGTFAVAAATAGASTVSLDLSKKWLDRLPSQFQANGMEFDERHDAIYGDCFEWMVRLAKRGEKFDIVILDPPNTSVMGSRQNKRWSVKSNMDELVALASELVLPGGLLWATTSSSDLSVVKFARLCRKGLEQAGVPNARLERIQPMPTDFQTVGPQNVKNLVWRFPS